jgi:hypothetical protein
MNSEQLLTYLAAPAQHPAVEAHLATCAVCRGKLTRLAGAVLASPADRLTCDQCQARLPEYVQAQVEGRAPAALFPEVAGHLARCPRCRRLQRELLAIGELTLAGDLPRPAAHRPADLSFLRRPAAPARFGEIVRRGAFWVQDRAQGLFLDLSAFLQALGPRPALAPAFAPVPAVRPRPVETWRDWSRGYESEDVVYQITLGQEELEDLTVEVVVYRRPERPEVARVVIQVAVPSRLLAGFAGSQVQMKTDATTRIARTDDDGLTVFEDVPLADLHAATFTITPFLS